MNWKFWQPQPVISPTDMLEMQRQARLVKNNGTRLKHATKRTEKVKRENHLGENVKRAMGG